MMQLAMLHGFFYGFLWVYITNTHFVTSMVENFLMFLSSLDCADCLLWNIHQPKMQRLLAEVPHLFQSTLEQSDLTADLTSEGTLIHPLGIYTDRQQQTWPALHVLKE